jgi:ribonuclease E
VAQPAVAAEVLNPALEAAVALPSVTTPDVDTVISSTQDVIAGEAAAEGEGSARRRRGRRGGRRRRRGGAENASATDADSAQDQDEMLAGDMPAAAPRSQPEFDFEDEEPGAIAPAVIDHATPKQAHSAEPRSVRPAAFAAQAVEPAVLAQPEVAAPVDAMPVDATPMEAMSMEAAAVVANIEPAATEPQAVDIETTPTASIEPTASEPDEVESASIEPAVPMFAESEPQATDNAASASASASVVEAAVADVTPMQSTVPAPSPGLFDMLPNAPVIDIDPAEEAAKAVAHVNESTDGADNESARNA